MWLADGTPTTRQRLAQRSTEVIFYPQCYFHAFGQNKTFDQQVFDYIKGDEWKEVTFSDSFESFEYSQMALRALNNLRLL